MNGLIVVDASLAVKWLVEEEGSGTAAALAQFWRNEGTKLVAPPLMAIEVANALHRRVVRGEISVADAARLLENLLTSGIECERTQPFCEERWSWQIRFVRELYTTRTTWRSLKAWAASYGLRTRSFSARPCQSPRTYTDWENSLPRSSQVHVCPS